MLGFQYCGDHRGVDRAWGLIDAFRKFGPEEFILCEIKTATSNWKVNIEQIDEYAQLINADNSIRELWYAFVSYRHRGRLSDLDEHGLNSAFAKGVWRVFVMDFSIVQAMRDTNYGHNHDYTNCHWGKLMFFGHVRSGLGPLQRDYAATLKKLKLDPEDYVFASMRRKTPLKRFGTEFEFVTLLKKEGYCMKKGLQL